MELPKKGTMRNAKKVFGWFLIAAGVGFIFGIDQITTVVMDYTMVFGIVLAIAGYFHAFSGRQL